MAKCNLECRHVRNRACGRLEKSGLHLLLMVPGGEVESPCLAAAVFETATSTDSVTPARDVAA